VDSNGMIFMPSRGTGTKHASAHSWAYKHMSAHVDADAHMHIAQRNVRKWKIKKCKKVKWSILMLNSIIWDKLKWEQQALCKIWGFHGGDYEECCLLGCYAVWLLLHQGDKNRWTRNNTNCN
jgi:hypothetical protein